MKSAEFSGVMTALITPFLKGAVDFPSLKKLIRHQLDNGIQGFIVAGSTGEAATLSLEEKLKVLDFVVGEAAGQVPVIMGSGTFNTQETCELCKTFSRPGVAALLVVTPYYNRPPQRGLEAHFLTVARSTKLPVIIYNVPSRTASSILPETVAQIAAQAPNVIGIKEATGQVEIVKNLVKQCSSDFVILSGDDETFLEAMTLGAAGVISVVSHVIPRWCVDAAKQVAAGKDSMALVEKMRPLTHQVFCESNPIPVKWALKEMGIISSAELRLPLVELDPKFHGPFRAALKTMGALS